MTEILGLREAVVGAVHDGDTVALEGFAHLILTAAAHEILRQGRRDLTLVRLKVAPDLETTDPPTQRELEVLRARTEAYRKKV